MKRISFGFIFAVVLLAASVSIKAQSQPSPFAGNWVLDREKTNTTKDFPIRLKNYKMTVAGTDAQLSVKNEIEGKVEIQAAGQGARTGITESASRIGGGEARGGSTSSTGTPGINYGGTMALYFTVNSAVYNLNGKEEKVETPGGVVRIKAKPDNSGKVVQFVIIRRMKTQSGEMELTTRETWKLSEDGKTLKLFRTVETPSTRDEITMYLSKAV